MTIRKVLFGALVALPLIAASAFAQETRSFTDDLGRVVEVPVKPLRIVSLHDSNLTVPLLELGVVPVGSHGRTTEAGEPYIRSSAMLTGVDFSTSAIEFVGNLPADIEAVAALEPDLILTIPWQTAPLDQLEAIAPTIVFDSTTRRGIDMYQALAELTGTEDRLTSLEGRYQEQIAQIKKLVDVENTTVNVMQGNQGVFYVTHTYGGLGKILRDAGFTFPEAVEALGEGGEGEFTGERLPELDADVIFVTYRAEGGETAAIAEQALEAVMPGFCDFLHACREGQILYLPRDEGHSSSYAALSMTSFAVLTQLSGRNVVRRQQ
ncbi:MAG: ABC transporter substrate-binding protein [Devosia sp.]|uniref:ABC transporter substrate-binding protein n=1 Tax=Devosia sp. TaxID=1871048 RepID=UPI0024CC7970|nr:ABC transporter substrate-binding protein [Devosia sp.]UYN99816.1 MAG: ABC transporter substrate-binding protein [Devosia sp.]